MGWIGVRWAPSNDIIQHREAFVNILGRGKLARKLGGLWTCVLGLFGNGGTLFYSKARSGILGVLR